MVFVLSDCLPVLISMFNIIPLNVVQQGNTFRPVCTQSFIIIIMEKFNVSLYILIYVSNADALPLHCSLRNASGYILSETPGFPHLAEIT